MPSRLFKTFLCAIFVVTLLVPTETAFAKTPSVESLTETSIADATVNLYCRLKSGRKAMNTTGSGVFISDRGVILTNAHVARYFLLAEKGEKVSGWCSIRTNSPAKDRFTASVLYIPKPWITQVTLDKGNVKATGENDFALLYVTGAKKGTLPVTFPSLPLESIADGASGDPVTIAGYPAEKMNFDKIRSSLKRTIASSTVTDTRTFSKNTSDVLTLAPSKAGSAGVSGGPIINADQELIGIVTSKSSAKNDRTLRGITVSYINRILYGDIGKSLTTLSAEDFTTRTTLTNASVSPLLIQYMTNVLLK